MTQDREPEVQEKVVPLAGQSSRKASKEMRRQQLIEATIDTLATKGYAATTLADVAKAAGLSGGIVNFHFETKDKLLVETLRQLAL
jgi:TetR/AcrR family transcriptional repressor of bet genes